MVGLAGVALAIAMGLYVLDHYLNNRGYGSPFEHYFNFHDDAVSNSIGVLSSIIAAVLGIIITVVSIVVQLAATRYTPAVTSMFFRDRTNLGVFGLYIIGCIIGFWTAFGVNADFVPRVSLLVMLCIATLGFVLMAPYFAYVFNFLAPQNIVARLKAEALRAAQSGGKGDEAVNERQAL